jgi:hypothetical protein
VADLFEERDVSVIIMRTDYPTSDPRWSGTAECKLKDGTTLKITTSGHADQNAVYDSLAILLRRRLTPYD